MGLQTLHLKLHINGENLILSDAHTQPYFLMHQAGLFDGLSTENVTANLSSALDRARKLLPANA